MKQKIGFHFEGIYTEAEITVAAQTVFVHSFAVDDMQIEPTGNVITALHFALCSSDIVHNRIFTKRETAETDEPMSGMRMN